MKFSALLSIVLAAALAACAGNGGSGSSAGASPRPTNPVDFPLFDGAEVLSAREFHETVQGEATGANGFLPGGAGTYDGHETVAGTQALMPVLEGWLHDLSDHPPAGYSLAVTGNGLDAVRDHTRAAGIDFAAFERTENGKQRGVVVLIVDPQLLDQKAGPMLGMISKFKLLPQSLRDPIDVQTKKETGFTVTEATNPDNPLGAAVLALDQLRSFGGQGVVLIDAVKQ
jgi:hypothetical protein